jgi:hypothetical protein
MGRLQTISTHQGCWNVDKLADIRAYAKLYGELCLHIYGTFAQVFQKNVMAKSYKKFHIHSVQKKISYFPLRK